MSDPAGTNGHRRKSKHRRIGWWIRIAVLLTWAGLYGHHASEHLLLSLGLVERRDVSTIIRHHNQYRYRYDLLTASGERVGNLFLEYQFVDTNWESSLVLDLDRIDFVPGIGAILSRLEQLPGDTVHLEFTTFHDDRFRLSRLEAQGDILGIAGSFEGRIDHTGLVGQLSIPSLGEERDVHLPGFLDTGDDAAGMDLAHALPPGLVPGDRFRTQVIALDWKPPTFMKRVPVVYRVVERVPGPDGDELNRIEIVQDGATMGELTANDDGVIYRTRHRSSGLQMQLRSVFHNGGKIWPRDEIPGRGQADDDQAPE